MVNLNEKSIVTLRAHSSVSALGSNVSEVVASYHRAGSGDRTTLIENRKFSENDYPVCRLSVDAEARISALLEEKPAYRKLDRSVQLALAAADSMRSEIKGLNTEHFFINIGSSRGATGIFERAHGSYLESGNAPVLTSPFTTLGNISSWVMQEIGARGSGLSTSVTCSTALQAVFNGIAWLRSGMASHALVGAAEAPLTEFTISQMRALRIYAEPDSGSYPATPMAAEYPAKSGMVLGEGAAIFLLEMKDREELTKGDIFIESIGYGSEKITSPTSISEDGKALYQAMKMAVDSLPDKRLPDIILAHAPGNPNGDRAESRAIRHLASDYQAETPGILSNKWIIGHTLAAAGAFNMEYAMHILQYNHYAEFPYPTEFTNPAPGGIKRVMVNAAGFGGNAASLILSVMR